MPTQTLIWMFILMFLGSCQSDENKRESLTELQQAKRLWERSEVDSYTITQRISCFCIESYTRPRQIQIQNGSITQVDGETYDPDQDPQLYTVSQFFAFIEERMSRDPYRVTLVFDPTYGFPTEAYFDYEEMIADDEIGYYFSAFEIN